LFSLCPSLLTSTIGQQQDIVITFYSPTGNLPVLTVDATALTFIGGTVAVSAAKTRTGTKEDIVCNNRGRCGTFNHGVVSWTLLRDRDYAFVCDAVIQDEDSGMCMCALHHASSDARGGYGSLNDCGVVDKFMTHGNL
jgi:hypothetical protein